MKKTMLFLLVMVLLETMGAVELAWAQIKPTQPKPVEPTVVPKGYEPLPTPFKPSPPPPPPSKIVFVTSQKYTGNLGSMSSGDAICQHLAGINRLPGLYKAWLSNDYMAPLYTPATTFTKSTGPYKLLDGRVVANNWDSLVSDTLLI